MKELRKIVRQTLQEYITPGELKNVEKFADNLFSNIGVDVEFTRHFLDRVNDLRNKTDITPEELKDLYVKTYKKYSELIPLIRPGEERVLTDPETNINVPFVMNWDGRSPELDMVNKTIMRKKDFKTSSASPKLTLEVIKEAIGRIKKIKLNGTYYHGTSIQEDNDLFNEFNPQYSDWEATWFSSDESIAIDFADSAHREENEIQVIYKVTLKCAPIADISYEQSQEMMESWGLFDFREVIPILIQKGFRGWKTPGSIGSTLYDDIAIFSTHCIDIQAVKLFIDGTWTNYMPLYQAQEMINAKRGNVDEDINVPINVGDTVLGGRFKNKKIVVKDIDKNEKGDITINDKPLLKVRIPKSLNEDEDNGSIEFLEKKAKFNTNYGVGSSAHRATWQDGWNYFYKYDDYKIKKDSNWIDDKGKIIAVAKTKNNPDKIVQTTITNFKNSDEPLFIDKDVDDSELKHIIKSHEEKLKEEILNTAANTDSKRLVDLVNKNAKGFKHIINHLMETNKAKNIGEAFIMTIADFYPEYRLDSDAILKIALSRGYQFTNYKDFKKLLYNK